MEIADKDALMRTPTKARVECRTEEVVLPPEDSGGVSNYTNHGQASSREKWPVEDDITLISSVIHSGDIDFISKAAKFSQKYTVTELEKRWFDLMYDDQINARAKFRLSRCSPDLIDRMESRVPLSLSEKFVLEDRSLVQIADAQKLMLENPAAFQYARTPQQLIDQSHILNMAKSRRTNSRFVPFDVRLARPSSYTSEEADPEDIRPLRAMPEKPYLKGKNAVFPILHDRVLIGRSTSMWKADVNLSEEGPASIIARKQAILSRDAQNEYKIKNTGRRPMIVDAKVLLEGDYTIIHDYSVIEIAYIRLVFKCL
ncbi:mcrs-1 [Pristionchus pacificus]|uniref:Mcrs-1 n=1 Tax=Pristionchus pacificus TaxID=54126 RepID=A0A2A6BTI1_PRIPA|nr:mcrs-1 [Pristionchus pacificus]|eukprot:PDM69167.1 mcrs-1 [Pristionchus pacificus]